MKFNYKVGIKGEMADGTDAIMDVKAKCVYELEAILSNAFDSEYYIIECNDPDYNHDHGIESYFEEDSYEEISIELTDEEKQIFNI